MPMYDFECTQCGNAFETITPSDAPPPPCPECQAPSERLISAPFFGKGKITNMGPKARKYMNPDFQKKLKAEAEAKGQVFGPPRKR